MIIVCGMIGAPLGAAEPGLDGLDGKEERVEVECEEGEGGGSGSDRERRFRWVLGDQSG